MIAQKEQRCERLSQLLEYIDKLTQGSTYANYILDETKQDQREILNEMTNIKEEIDELMKIK